jgi:DNA mismatch repair ATPase MutS
MGPQRHKLKSDARTHGRMTHCSFFLPQQVLDGLAGRIVETHLPLLHRLLDNLALLDMLLSLAQVAAACEGQYVRPVLTEAGGCRAVYDESFIFKA